MTARLNRFSLLRLLLCIRRIDRGEIVAFQNVQLRRLIRHAYRNVPHYRRLFDHTGIKPEDIRTVADLSAIPVTAKKDLATLSPEEVVARGVDPRSLAIHKTSGSSGEPFTIRRTRSESALLEAFRFRAMRYYGLRMTDRRAAINLLRPSPRRARWISLRTLRTLGNYRRTEIDCLRPPEEIIAILRDLHPDIVGGFAGAVSQVAQLMNDDDRRIIRPRFVVVGGEVLTPLMRQQVFAAFQAPVFNLYGSHEFNLIAWQCKETGDFHTCDDGMIVEVLKGNRPASAGERGEVVGTSLHSFAMPFIRYRLGDIVTKGSETCACGMPFSTIRAIQGRMVDYFPLPNGRVIHPYEIVLILMREGAPWLRSYRLLQEREDRVLLYAVASVEPTRFQLDRLATAITAVLGRDVEFQVRLVPEIQLEESGKFRISRSLVRSNYDGIDWGPPSSG